MRIEPPILQSPQVLSQHRRFTARPALVAASQVASESKGFWKPGVHFIGSRVETGRFQAMGVNWIQLVQPHLVQHPQQLCVLCPLRQLPQKVWIFVQSRPRVGFVTPGCQIGYMGIVRVADHSAAASREKNQKGRVKTREPITDSRASGTRRSRVSGWLHGDRTGCHQLNRVLVVAPGCQIGYTRGPC
jgi:hypothetical protein